MSKQLRSDTRTLRQALAPRASEFVDAHIVIGLHAVTGGVVFYAEGPRRQQVELEDAMIRTAKAIEKAREAKARRRAKR